VIPLAVAARVISIRRIARYLESLRCRFSLSCASRRRRSSGAVLTDNRHSLIEYLDRSAIVSLALHACNCGGSGAICPACNAGIDDEPRLPVGSKAVFELEDWRHQRLAPRVRGPDTAPRQRQADQPPRRGHPPKADHAEPAGGNGSVDTGGGE
jgi:hypothetical protein